MACTCSWQDTIDPDTKRKTRVRVSTAANCREHTSAPVPPPNRRFSWGKGGKKK